jgi:hypothetical protein
VKNFSDNSTTLAAALAWSTRITGISAQMVLPGLFGYWLDLRLNTKFVFVAIGILLGMASGLWSLIRLVRERH